MNIHQITPYNKISFQSAHRVYNTKTVNQINTFGTNCVHTTTQLFREDLDWINLIKYAIRHFADKTRVNAYSLASSDGSEAYTYAITLLENLPESMHQKFFPIKACDIDEEMINAAKSGKINIYGGEFNVVKKLGIDMKKYFINETPAKEYTNDEVYYDINSSSYEPIPELRNCVKFKQSDILTELKNIEDNGNSIVLCRNVMPYLAHDYVDEIVKTAKEKLQKGSLFVTGNYDYKADIENKLLSNGFFKPFIDKHNIFERGDYKELTNRLLMGYLI